MQDAPHGVEGAKDHDSISGPCRSDGGLQRQLGTGECTGTHVAPPTCHHLQRVPFGNQLRTGFGPRGGQVGEIPAVHQRVDTRQHGAQVLVGHGSKHRVGDGVKPHGIDVFSECGDRMRVVRHVQHQHWLARNDLKAAGQLHQRQPVAHGLGRDRQHGAQGFQRGQHTRCIHQLVGTTQCRVGQAAVTPPAPGPTPLLLVAGKVEIHPKTPDISPQLGGVVQHTLRRHRVADDHRLAGAHDAGLLAANTFARGAEVFHVVQVDAGDHGAVGIHDVDRVQPPAQPHFEDGHIQPGQGQQPQDGQRGELEVRE